jgi:enterochelin esterase-like enzyme
VRSVCFTLRFLLLVVACPLLCTAQAGSHPRSAVELIQLANDHSPLLQQAIESTYPAKAIALGRVWSGYLHDFFFTVRAPSRPRIFIDDQTGPEMQPIQGTDLWYVATTIQRLGALHSFHYRVAGKDFGGSTNMPAFGELSYPMPNVRRGILTAKETLVSKIYDGMKTDFWVYVPSGYDPKDSAALMLFQDGGNVLSRDGGSKILDVIDNLIYQKKIPLMICVFVNPGTIDGSGSNPTFYFVKSYGDRTHRALEDATRSVLYDAVSDRYPRFLRDELLPEIAAQYNLRKDAYSHAIAGFSSGGISSFNAAWQFPQVFSRVLCGISSFASIQWNVTPQNPDGGQDYPDKVLQEQHRNIRVWLQDGSDDLESDQYGSWALNNLRMANALKLKDYDFHFSFGKGGHGPEQVEAQFPEAMAWLWRNYDPSKNEQTFEMEPSEKAKPLFRVAVFNRDAD